MDLVAIQDQRGGLQNLKKTSKKKKKEFWCSAIILNSLFHGSYKQAGAMECEHVNVKLQ